MKNKSHIGDIGGHRFEFFMPCTMLTSLKKWNVGCAQVEACLVDIYFSKVRF